MGLETEYVLRFSSRGGSKPIREILYRAVEDAIRDRVQAAPGEVGYFLQNGAALNFEQAAPRELRGGLLEMATPECRGPGQLFVYQKAQEALLVDVLPQANRLLAAQGYEGALTLIKNSRDAEGNTYGVQENYEVTVAEGAGLRRLRIGSVFFRGFIFAAYLGIRLLSYPLEVLERLAGGEDRVESMALDALRIPFKFLAAFLARNAFLRIRRQAAAFLVSRIIFTGAGTVSRDGRFALCERASALTGEVPRMDRWQEYPIFQLTNLMKPYLSFDFSPAAFRRLLNPVQRLQLGCSDANLAEPAEYLKVGTTALVLDMVEAGYLDDAPFLADPVWALRALSEDPTLQVKVPTRDGRRMSALELQTYYLEKAQTFVRASNTPSTEAHQLIRTWEETLIALQQDPSSLFGQVDWVTKRVLLSETDEESLETRKKLDIKYHELGTGYLATLKEGGYSPTMVEPEELERAKLHPPENSPGFERGRAVSRMDLEGVRFSWDRATIGGSWNRKVVPFRRR